MSINKIIVERIVIMLTVPNTVHDVLLGTVLSTSQFLPFIPNKRYINKYI